MTAPKPFTIVIEAIITGASMGAGQVAGAGEELHVSMTIDVEPVPVAPNPEPAAATEPVIDLRELAPMLSWARQLFASPRRRSNHPSMQPPDFDIDALVERILNEADGGEPALEPGEVIEFPTQPGRGSANGVAADDSEGEVL